jgi:hypothetical protein
MTIEELKALILWCKVNKVKSFSKDGIAFELSDLAFIENFSEDTEKEIYLDNNKTFADDEKPEASEEDEMLYWSVNR